MESSQGLGGGGRDHAHSGGTQAPRKVNLFKELCPR